MAEHQRDPSQRKAQHALAREVVELVHSEEDAKNAELNHRSIFRIHSSSSATHTGSEGEKVSGSKKPVTEATAPVVNITLPYSLVIDKPPARVLFSAGLVNSRSEGHRLAQNQGAYIGSSTSKSGQMGDGLSFAPVKLWDSSKTRDYLIDGNLLILRQGKWKIKIVKVISDEEFERLGLNAPGWEEEQNKRRAAKGAAEGGAEQPLVRRVAIQKY